MILQIHYGLKLVSDNYSLAVIPARAGSKGILRKNLVDLGGKPLVVWTLEAALKSKVSRTIVCTDDHEVGILAKEMGIEVMYQPSPMKDGKVNAVNVVLHVLQEVKNAKEPIPDCVLNLLPTSPFRDSDDIDGAIEIYEFFNSISSVIGVCETKPLLSLRYIRDDKLVPIRDIPLNQQRQDVERVYAVNGAMFLISVRVLEKIASFHLENSIPFIMSHINSIDINLPEDLEFARHLVERRGI